MKDWDKWVCARNERQIKRGDSAAEFVLAVVLGVVEAVALRHWWSS